MLALLSGLLFVCVTVPANKDGLFILLKVGAGKKDFWVHAYYAIVMALPQFPYNRG